MSKVITQLRMISRQFEDIVHSVAGHRKELAKSIRQTNTTYVRLFERMLFVVLKLQRKKDFESQNQVVGLRDQISSLVLQVRRANAIVARSGASDSISSPQHPCRAARERESSPIRSRRTIYPLPSAALLTLASLALASIVQNDLLQAQLLKLGDQTSALIGLNQSLHVENSTLSAANDELDKYGRLYHQQMGDHKMAAVKNANERQKLVERMKREEEALIERFKQAEAEWAKERKKMFEELKLNRRPIIQKVVASVEKIDIPKRKPKAKKIVVKAPSPEKKVVELKEGTSQTEVNDDGLWQRQDGWVINVDEDVLAKALWRRAIRFAACPCCQGAGEFLKNAIEMSKDPKKVKKEEEEDSDEDPSDAVEDGGKKIVKKRGRRSGVHEEWMLPDDLVEFLSNLPKSVQGTSPKPLPWLCRELNGILDEKLVADELDDKEGQQTQAMNDFLMELYLKRHGLRRLAELNLYVLLMSIREHYKKSSLAHTFARFMHLVDEPKKKKGTAHPDGDVKMTNKHLDTSFLSAYLWTRGILKREYMGVYVYGTVEREEGGEGSLEGVPAHIVVDAGSQFYLPMDLAVQVTKLVLGFLAPRKLAIYSRQIEKNAHVLYRNGKIGKGSGARMQIRSVMRMSMLQTAGKRLSKTGDKEEGGEDEKNKEKPEEEKKEEDCQVVVDMYSLLELLMEILTLRESHMEDQLKRFFIEGDDNGDGVLSFDEFDTLLTRIAPQFSSRRILRMFREALTGGEEGGFAIEKSTFADVCRNHGMVKLIDTETLEKEMEEAEAGDGEEEVTQEEKKENHEIKMEKLKTERKLMMMSEEDDEEEEEDDEEEDDESV